MSWSEHLYARWNKEEGSVEYRPEVALKVAALGREIPVIGLVDSGASRCMINQALAGALGVDLDTCTKTVINGLGGVGRPGYYYADGVRFIFEELEFEFVCPVVFGEIFLPCILGQDDFFLHFDVLFKRSQGIFKLDSIPPLADDIR